MLITKISNEKQLDIVVELAYTIWNEYFTPIIGQAQVDYMLDKFQSKKSIGQQLQNGFVYYLITNNSEPVGYTGIIIKEKELFLSKIYILSTERNKGIGKEAISFLEQFALEQGAQKITLTVNKDNLDTIEAYKKMGFVNLGSVVQDIGNNFVMDDYKMEKELDFTFMHHIIDSPAD